MRYTFPIIFAFSLSPLLSMEFSDNKNNDPYKFPFTYALEMKHNNGTRVILYGDKHTYGYENGETIHYINQLLETNCNKKVTFLIEWDFNNSDLQKLYENQKVPQRAFTLKRLVDMLQSNYAKNEAIQVKSIETRTYAAMLPRYFASRLRCSYIFEFQEILSNLSKQSYGRVLEDLLFSIEMCTKKYSDDKLAHFTCIYEEINNQINEVKKRLKNCDLTLDTSLQDLIFNEKFNDLFLDKHFPSFLSLSVDARILDEIYSAQPGITVVVVAGGNHVKRVREFLLRTGFHIIQRVDRRENSTLSSSLLHWITQDVRTCSWCMKNGEMLTCKKCKKVMYCSKE